MKNNLLFVLIFPLIFSCSDLEMVVELDIPPHEPVLVLNGILDTDTTFSIMLSHSIGAFDQGIPSNVSDAQVSLYENDQLVDVLNQDVSNQDYNYFTGNDNYYWNYDQVVLSLYSYVSDYTPISNANYRIEVSHPDYSFISAVSNIPEDIDISSIEIDTSNTEYLRVSFTFIDDPNQQNFYRVRALGNCSKNLIDEVTGNQEFIYFTLEDRIELNSNDPSLQSEGIPFEGYTFVGDEALFSDVLFDGQQKTMTFDLDTYYLKWTDCDTLMLQLTSFSEDSYIYFNSLQQHSDNGAAGIFGGEVVPVYSNVEGGLGVLISANAQPIYIKQ
tara:strand:+ start:510 stop:1496 length:987 start_codon:yes stop_codon:yes gene_type:complete